MEDLKTRLKNVEFTEFNDLSDSIDESIYDCESEYYLFKLKKGGFPNYDEFYSNGNYYGIGTFNFEMSDDYDSELSNYDAEIHHMISAKNYPTFDFISNKGHDISVLISNGECRIDIDDIIDFIKLTDAL